MCHAITGWGDTGQAVWSNIYFNLFVLSLIFFFYFNSSSHPVFHSRNRSTTRSMNILLTPRKKTFSQEEREPTHRLKDCSLRHTLENSVFSYVYWLQELLDIGAEDVRLARCIVSDLLPLEENDSYAQKVRSAFHACTEDVEDNNNLMAIMLESMSLPMKNLFLSSTACETLERVKHHFAPMMDPFRLLQFERSLTFEKDKLLQYYTSLDAMAKVYFHVFRKHAPQELEVLWMMTSLTNDLLRNREIIQEIQQDWTNLHSNAAGVRLIINSHLYHRRFRPLCTA